MANAYPAWWNQAITIFNKFEDPETHEVSWYSHILDGCFWLYSHDKLSINNDSINTNSVTCRIRKSPFFKEGYEWEELSTEDKQKYFTVNPGDIIVRDRVLDSIDEYTKNQRSSDLVTKYKHRQGCMIVDYMLDNTGEERNEEHYHVRGV